MNSCFDVEIFDAVTPKYKICGQMRTRLWFIRRKTFIFGHLHLVSFLFIRIRLHCSALASDFALFNAFILHFAWSESPQTCLINATLSDLFMHLIS